MKQKILAGIATGLIIFSGTITPLFGFFFTQFQTPVAEAQADCIGTPCTTTVIDTYGPQQQGVDTGGFSAVQSSGTYAAPEQTEEQKKAAAEAKKAAEDDALKCGLNPVCKAVKTLTSVFMYPSFLFAAMGGLFMDYVIWGTINSTSYSDGTDGNQSGIGTLAVAGWKLVRDITNILFIFALFVVGFNLILNRESANEKGVVTAVNSFGMDPKRTLVRVILMALLVNFSFFIGKAIITTANVAAVVFFNKIDTSTSNSNPSYTSSGGDISTLYGANYFPGIKSVSLKILGKSNPQALVLNTTGDSGTNFSVAGITLWGSYDWSTYILMISITGIVSFFNFFLCYLFFSIAFLLMGRTLGLVMALIVSPLAFVSFAIPSLEDKPYIGFSDWFTQFVGLAATAPIFLFFLFIVTSTLDIKLQGAGFFATTLFILIKLSFASGFLIFAKRITKNLAGRVGAVATKVVTAVAVNAAIIGTAAATGGASAALFAARRQATQGAISAGNSILGSERTEALQKRMGGLRNFRTLPSSPRDAIMGLSGIIAPGSKVPGQINDGITQGQRYGTIMNRKNNIKNIREERLAAEAAAASKRATDRVNYNYDSRKAAQDLRDAQKAKGGTPATLGDGRAKAPTFTPTQEDRIKKKLAENKAKLADIAAKKKANFRKTYNFDARKAAQDLRTAAVTKNGISPTLGDGTAKPPVFTPVQQERILNKAIAAEAKRVPVGTPAVQPVVPVDPKVTKIDEALRNREAALKDPSLRKDERESLEKSFSRLEEVKKNLLGQTPPIPPDNNPPAGGASPVKPPVPPIAAGQPAQTKVAPKAGPRPGQTEPTDGTARPKTAFTGDANFDRPKTQLVDPQGRPVSSADLAQKEESQKLASQYRNNAATPITQIENLTVKANNLNIVGSGTSTTPTITLPNRNSGGGSAAGAPRDRAASLLTNIQMPPRATSSVSNYSSTSFAPKSTLDQAKETVNNAFDKNFEQKYQNVKPVIDKYIKEGKIKTSGFVDPLGNPISSQKKPDTDNKDTKK